MPVIATQFAPVPTALLRNPSISPQAKALYAVIRSYADHGRQTGARPSTQTLARMMGLCQSAVKGWRRELVNAGWIRTRARLDKKGRTQHLDYWCLDQQVGGGQRPGTGRESAPSLWDGVGQESAPPTGRKSAPNREPNYTKSPDTEKPLTENTRKRPQTDSLQHIRGILKRMSGPLEEGA